MSVKVGELFIEVKTKGADSAVDSVGKVDKELKKTELAAKKAERALNKALKKSEKEAKETSKALAKVGLEVGRAFRNVVEVGGSGGIDALEGGISSVASMLGPIGLIATGITAATFAMYKFIESVGDTALQFHNLQTLAAFPEDIASKYEYAAQSVGASAGEMTNAIQGVANTSAQAMMYGNIPPALLQLARFSGRPLTKEIIQDPQKLLEYEIGAIQSPNNKLNPLIKSSILSQLIPGLSPNVRNAILEGKTWKEALKNAPELKKGDIETLTSARRKEMALGMNTSAFFTKAGAGVIKTGEVFVNAAKATINGMVHPETIKQPYEKRIPRGATKIPEGIGIPTKKMHHSMLDSGFKINDQNIVSPGNGKVASSTTNNTEGSKTSNIYLNAPHADHSKVADEVVARVSSLFSSQVQMA